MLNHSSDFPAHVIEQLKDSVLLLDEHGRVVYTNQSALLLLEASSSDAIGRSLQELWGESIPELSKVAGSGQRLRIGRRMRNGRRVSLFASCSRLSQSSHGSNGAVLVIAQEAPQAVTGFGRPSPGNNDRHASTIDPAERRAWFIADAAAILTASLDYQLTLKHLAQLTVPELADWCVVYGLLPSGGVRRLDMVARPEAQALLERLSAYEPGDWLRQNAIAAQLRSGKVAVVEQVPDALLRDLATDADHLALLQEAGFRSLLAVPMCARGQVIGAMVLLTAASGRVYGQTDVETVCALAHHAALSVDNARLHEELEVTVQQRTEALIRSNAGLEAEVTERTKTAVALRASEEQFRGFVEATQEWIWSSDRDGRLTYSNPAVQHMLGYTPTELAGADRLTYVHDDDRTKLTSIQAQSVSKRQGWPGLRVRWRHRDGSYRYLEGSAFPVLTPDGALTGFSGADRDVTDQMRMEEQLRQAHKLEALGRLAGGIAHDFNNLLMVILGRCELLTTDPSSSWHEHTQTIERAAERAMGLTRQLLVFGRKQVLRPIVCDLNAVIGSMLPMAQRFIGEHIESSPRLAREELRVSADPAQLEQVVMNLILNARDAMSNGGRLTVETCRTDVGADGANGDVPPGSYACFVVGDTGEGMDAATLSQIFDPFFTTKPAGKGTGLGLSTVHGIVRQSGGYVSVTSIPGNGTTFRMLLPLTTLPLEAASATPLGPWETSGSETVLLVEDDPGVRVLLRDALLSAGFRVLEAADGEEGLSLAARYESGIDLLLTDVIMPRLGGLELAQQLRERRSSIKVIYVSGYSEEAVGGKVDLRRDTYVQKPVTPREMIRRVRQTLDHPLQM